MEFVWGEQTNISREALFLRKSIADGLRWAGSLFLCRQVWTEYDFKHGSVKRCPRCFDEVLKQTVDTRCSNCFGTGYDGGYQEPFIVRAHLQENTRAQDAKENAGLTEKENTSLKLACDGHIYTTGDVFAEVKEMKDNKVTVLGRIFQISGPVNRQLVQGFVSNDNPSAIMNLEDRMVSQTADIRLLLETDNKYLLSKEFWGLESHEMNPDRHSEPIKEFEDTTFGDRWHMSSWEQPE